MKFTPALAAAILAATSIQAVPVSKEEATSQLTATSALEHDDAKLQLSKRDADLNLNSGVVLRRNINDRNEESGLLVERSTNYSEWLGKAKKFVVGSASSKDTETRRLLSPSSSEASLSFSDLSINFTPRSSSARHHMLSPSEVTEALRQPSSHFERNLRDTRANKLQQKIAKSKSMRLPDTELTFGNHRAWFKVESDVGTRSAKGQVVAHQQAGGKTQKNEVERLQDNNASPSYLPSLPMSIFDLPRRDTIKAVAGQRPVYTQHKGQVFLTKVLPNGELQHERALNIGNIRQAPDLDEIPRLDRENFLGYFQGRKAVPNSFWAQYEGSLYFIQKDAPNGEKGLIRGVRL